MAGNITISLLHATHAAGASAVAVRDRWLALAARPELVEHLFAFDADDAISASTPEIAGAGGLPSLGGRVTAVRNWNDAARRATGQLLMVIADDLTPATDGWDDALRAKCGHLDPTVVPFAMKVLDGRKPFEHLMRHPVVSRAFFKRYGLFDPAYFGIGVDNDFTNTAHCRGLVVDARDVRFVRAGVAEASTSHKKMSSDLESAFGKQLFATRWPVWKRRLIIRYFRPAPGRTSVSALRRHWRGVITRLGWCAALVPSGLRRRVRSTVVGAGE
ncbi:MAG: hypothetical protein WCK21_03605 [Actinomycetota bacterium]